MGGAGTWVVSVTVVVVNLVIDNNTHSQKTSFLSYNSQIYSVSSDIHFFVLSLVPFRKRQ